MNKLVSVIIPTYNRVNYILDALNSVYEQTYRPLEVIVVDDGSDDNTERIVKEWFMEHRKKGFDATFFFQENQGAPTARNRGIEIANGIFIKFLDSDDILHQNGVDRQVKKITKLDDNQIVFGDLGRMSHNGKKLIEQYIEPPNNHKNSFEYLVTKKEKDMTVYT